MKRCSGSGEDALQELETEGERQLKALLRQQLAREASVEQCVSKRHRFAPAALYKPFGEEAAGAHSLTEFQALQESSRETASLRELGLSDAEIHLWRTQGQDQKGPGLRAAPNAVQDRIQAIEEKLTEHQQILSLPQHFAGSRALSRREMEIENALFQGTDRHSFLRRLYRPGETQSKLGQERPQLDMVYQELLKEALPEAPPSPQRESGSPCPGPSIQHAPAQGTLGPVVVTELVASVPSDEILRNRLSKEEICQMPKFSSYSPGEPSKVLYLKNLSRHVTVKDLMSLFSRFQEEGGPPICFRLLSGRMRGQAFLTFPSVALAQEALDLLNGFRLLGRPLIIEFGRNQMPSGPGLDPDLASGTSSEL